MRVFLSLFLATAVWASQSINLSGVTGTTTPPNAAPFQNVGNLRIELRVTAWSAQSKRILEIQSDASYFAVDFSGSALRLWSGADGTYACEVSLTTIGQDAIAQFVRDRTDGKLRCRAWKTTDPSITTSQDATPASMAATPTLSGAFPWALGSSGLELKLAYLRVYFDNAYTSTPPPPMSPGSPALAWEFEGDGNETARVADWSLTGCSGCYATDDVLGPSVSLASPPYTVAVGTPTTLNASSSYPISAAGALSFAWSKLSGPGNVTITNGTTATPSVSMSAFGKYVVRAVVADTDNNSTTQDISINATVANAANVVTISNAAHSQLLGPMIRYGANPWPWMDTSNRKLMDAAIASKDTHWPVYWVTPETGTCKLTSESTALTCTGTSLGALYCKSGTAPCTSGNLKGQPAGAAYIILHLPSEDEPGKTLYRIHWLASIESDTAATLYSQHYFHDYHSTTCTAGEPSAACTVQFTAANDTDSAAVANWGCQGCSSHFNFYDWVVGLYSLCYRSGDSSYCDTARTWADQYWDFLARGSDFVIFNNGNNNTYVLGQLAGLYRAEMGVVLRATDDVTPKPEYWIGLSNILEWASRIYYYATGNFDTTGATIDNVGDGREMGYHLSTLAACSMYAGTAPVTAKYWFTSGTLKANCTEQLKKWATFLRDTPMRGPNKNFGNLNSLWGSRGGTGIGSGSTVCVTNGSTAVTGDTGTTGFSAIPATNPNTSQPFKIWFASSATPLNNAAGDSTTYNVVSVADDTHLTLERNYEGTTGCGKGWFVGGTPGYQTQPYMAGMAGAAFHLAYKAMLANGDPTCTGTFGSAKCSDLYKEFVFDQARWLWNYGRNQTTKGLYYSRGGPNCEEAISLGVDKPVGTIAECQSGTDPAYTRVVIGEIQRALSAAYELSPTAEFRGYAEWAATALWSSPYEPSVQYPGDGIYMSYIDTDHGASFIPMTGGVFDSQLSGKWVGFFHGVGRAATIPGALAGGTTVKPLLPFGGKGWVGGKISVK